MWYRKSHHSSPIHAVGDIHEKYHLLNDIYSRVPSDQIIYQLGDFGFNPEEGLRGIDPNRLKIIGGNHEHYPNLRKFPHYMGDFGVIPHPTARIFFGRGGESIDKNMRVEGRDWFPEEELNYMEGNAFLDEWERVRPDMMLSHTTPISATRAIVGNRSPKGLSNDGRGSRTDRLFEEALKIHRPRYWVHGHHHHSKDYELNGTKYISLGEGEYRPITLE